MRGILPHHQGVISFMELRTPIRLYWDVDGDSDGTDYAALCDQIDKFGFLSIDLTVFSSAGSSFMLKFLPEVARIKAGITLTITPALFSKIAAAAAMPANIKLLLLQIDSLADFDAVAPVTSESGDIPFGGISYSITKDTWRDLPEIVTRTIQSGLRLVLPMQRITRGETAFSLTRDEHQLLRQALSDLHVEIPRDIVIHDPFIWRDFFADQQFPEGKCQGANTMIFISGEGKVYPCPTFPFEIGDTRELSLKEIVRSELKKNTRELIRKLPTECSSCVVSEECCGGCRGRGYALSGSWESLDSGCL